LGCCARLGLAEDQETGERECRKNVVFFSCRSCGFVYQRRQPETRVLLDRYDDEYFEYERANEERFFSLMRLGLLDIGFFDIEQDLLARSFRFLDIGCATGRLLEFLRERGFDVEGVEICRASAEYGRRARGLSISTRPLEETGYAALSFGVVHCSHLIEHLQDPVGFVREVRRILVPGGYFICATPNIGGFQARLMGPRLAFRDPRSYGVVLPSVPLPRSWSGKVSSRAHFGPGGELQKGLAPDRSSGSSIERRNGSGSGM
jgi:2-polyprenyl-3-methyl-5-hydroxy-6-metoxy-1,4-benzoquinol methylase